MKRPTKNWINTIIGLAALMIALIILYHRLRAIGWKELTDHITTLKKTALFLALISTSLSYLILTGYDWIALHFLKKQVSYPRAALSAFIGASLSKNLGLSWLTGGSLRYRFYSRWGLDLPDVTKLTLFNTATFVLGFVFWGGLAFAFFPLIGKDLISYLPWPAIRIIGVVLLLLPSLYPLLCFSTRKAFSFRGHRWTLPSARIALLQLIIGALDVFFTLWTLYLLLPPGAFNLTSFFGIYFMGEVLAIMSHSPGGLGVFEAVMFELMKEVHSESALLSSLLLYRIIYFLIPLLIGILLLAIDELRLRKGSFGFSVLHPQKKSR